MLVFPCPDCEYRLLAHPGKAGKALACPRCKTSVTVPIPDTGSSVFENEPRLVEDSSILSGFQSASGGSTATAAPRRVGATPPIPTRPSVTVQDTAVFDTPFDTPTPAKNSEDPFVQLTTALTMRMNPPDPLADLCLPSGICLLATALGIGFWIFAVLHDTDWLKYVWAIGGLEFAIGIVWVVHRAGDRNFSKGLLALLHPVTLYRVIHLGWPDGYRPLRFILSGLLLIALPFIALPTRTMVRKAMGWAEPTVTGRSIDSPAALLRQISERSINTEIIHKEQQRLATVKRETVPAPEAVELVAEFRKLLKNENSDVRAESLRTLYAWEKDAARPDVIALLGSEYQDDRAAALSLLKYWPDEAAVKAAVDRLTSEDDRYYAKDTIGEIAKTAPKVVEAVLLDSLLKPPPQDPIPAKPLLELLELVGGLETVKGLDAFIAATIPTRS